MQCHHADYIVLAQPGQHALCLQCLMNWSKMLSGLCALPIFIFFQSGKQFPCYEWHWKMSISPRNCHQSFNLHVYHFLELLLSPGRASAFEKLCDMALALKGLFFPAGSPASQMNESLPTYSAWVKEVYGCYQFPHLSLLFSSRYFIGCWHDTNLHTVPAGQWQLQ